MTPYNIVNYLAGLLILSILFFVIFYLIFTSGIDRPPEWGADHRHDWAKAACTIPMQCLICGETYGKPLGHKFSSSGICKRWGMIAG